MKAAKNFFLIFVFCLVLLGAFVPIDSCACLTPSMIVELDSRFYNQEIEKYYRENSIYPPLEVLQEYQANRPDGGINITPLLAWSGKHKYQGIYYKTIDNGKGYVLEGYAEIDSLFGISFLKEVYLESN